MSERNKCKVGDLVLKYTLYDGPTIGMIIEAGTMAYAIEWYIKDWKSHELHKTICGSKATKSFRNEYINYRKGK